MANIIPFESGNLPAYLKQSTDFSDELTAHAASGGFPVISIKGNKFAVVRDGDRKIIPNPKDPDSPATSIDMVILKVNKNTSKVWYASGYTEGSDAKPDCFSNNGVGPDASSTNPQSKSCATCKHNQWGSKITPDGRKGKTCADSVRVAVATADQINDPYMIRVPAASIRAVGEYGAMLKKKGVRHFYDVVTKIGFDPESPTPKLTFKPVGFLSEAAHAQAVEMRDSDVVQNIMGGNNDAAPADEGFESAAPVAAAA